jgi:uncharacterized membrane protein YbhN (UPF0104 family)
MAGSYGDRYVSQPQLSNRKGHEYSLSIRNLLKSIFGLAALVFMAYYVYKNWGMLENYHWQFNIGLLLLSIVLLWLAIASSAFIYYLIFNRLASAKISFWQMFKAYNITNVGRYIPGKLWSVVGLIYYTSEYGVSKKQTTLAIVANEVSSKAAGLIVGICYFFFSNALMGYLPAMIIALVASLIAIHPWVLDKLINGILRFLKKQTIEITFTYPTILKYSLLYIPSWLLHSLAFYVLICSITPIGSINLIKFATILPLCWVIGYLVLMAPGGLGVREAMLVVMLGEFLPHEVALAAAVIQRIWFTFVEGINIPIALWLPIGRKKNIEQKISDR